MNSFIFNTYEDILTDGQIILRVKAMNQAIPQKKYVPAYMFNIFLLDTDEIIGDVDIRIGYTDDLVWYGGHVGYKIDEPFRGHGFAMQACKLIKKVAQDHGMDVLWITCDENNNASIRTLEKIGCKKIGLIDLPRNHDLYQIGQRRVWRFRWIIDLGSLDVQI